MKYRGRGHFPDYAQRYYEKTGLSLLDLINRDFSNDKIRMEFKRLELNRPTRAFLDYYRETFKNPSKLAKEVNYQFKEYLRSKLGLLSVNAQSILDSVILAGFVNLKNEGKVNTQELIKALDLKMKYPEGSTPGDIKKQIEDIFKGKNKKLESSVPEEKEK